MESDTIKRVVGALILTAVIILIGIIIPLTLGLGTGNIGEQEISNQIEFYQKFYWSLGVIWAIFIAFIFIKKNNKYGDSIGFNGIGKKPALSIFKNLSQFQLALISLIGFSAVFLLANILKFGGFTGLRVLPVQQFSPTQSLLFSTLLIPAPENLLLGAIIGLFILGLTLLATKYKLSEAEYPTYLYVGLFFVAGIFGRIWHYTAYPSSDISGYIIFIFWGVGALITVGTGSFIPFWIMHSLNNFFIDFQRLYSSDTLLIVMVSVIIGLIVLYYYLYKDNLFGGGSKPSPVLT